MMPSGLMVLLKEQLFRINLRRLNVQAGSLELRNGTWYGYWRIGKKHFHRALSKDWQEARLKLSEIVSLANKRREELKHLINLRGL